jgi:hypothetical protein
LIEDNLLDLTTAQQNVSKSSAAARKATLLKTTFVNSRDIIMGNLYDQVRERFVHFYTKLHESHETGFTAKIEPEEAGLSVAVGFHGKGNFPPNALHSEGHQDSMGICLCLALAERVAGDVTDLIMLDDVVMSVLNDDFPERQFVLTTHDRTWAKQLVSAGVIPSRNQYHFHSWEVALGPKVGKQEVNWWDPVRRELENNNVEYGAALLRRSLEEFFESACDLLKASIPYNSENRWTLGDFAPAAVSRLKRLLKDAKNAANSRSNQRLMEEIVEYESTVTQGSQRATIEQWPINSTVHYNNWTNFTANDLQPVVDAFQDLCSVFQHRECNTFLRVTYDGLDSAVLNSYCLCGDST